MKLRLDELLLHLRLAETRTQAKSLIMSGRVLTGTQRLDKPGKLLPVDTPITVEQPPRYVSRGGEKLHAALEHFQIDLTGAHILDVGASTGGFTDCALQHGASTATCIDVGRAQLHHRILTDPRVTNLEQINARHLNASQLPRSSYDAIVMDLSFISLRAVLPAVWPFLVPKGRLIALVKPQFEAGKAEADKHRGIIKDPALREKILSDITTFSLSNLPHAHLIGTIPSPITGADGNQEYLLLLQKSQ